MILSVHQPQYLPWLGFFDKIAKSECFVFLDTVQYKPREWQNRNKIRNKEDSIWLTVPVISKGQWRQSIQDVRIDNSTDWKKAHWKSLRDKPTCWGRIRYCEPRLPMACCTPWFSGGRPVPEKPPWPGCWHRRPMPSSCHYQRYWPV